MFKDRGIIKWAPLILPEHANLLKQLWAEDDNLSIPILDEQQLAEMDELLGQVFEQQLTVQLTWHNTSQKCSSIGKITNINFDEQTVDVQTAQQNKTIRIVNILNIVKIPD